MNQGSFSVYRSNECVKDSNAAYFIKAPGPTRLSNAQVAKLALFGAAGREQHGYPPPEQLPLWAEGAHGAAPLASGLHRDGKTNFFQDLPCRPPPPV